MLDHRLDDLVEPERAQDALLEVRHRVHELHGARHVVLDRKLDRTHVVAEGLGDLRRVADAPLLEGGLEVIRVLQVLAVLRIVSRDDDLSADDDAPDVPVPADRLLQHHDLGAREVIRREELLEAGHPRHMTPAPQAHGSQEGREANGLDVGFPRDRIGQIAKRRPGHRLRVPLLRKQDRLRDPDPEPVRERGVEEPVVARGQEGVVDDAGAAKACVTEVRSVVGDLVGDTIDDDVAFIDRIEVRPAEGQQRRLEPLHLALAQPVKEGAGERVLHAHQQSDLHPSSPGAASRCARPSYPPSHWSQLERGGKGT